MSDTIAKFTNDNLADVADVEAAKSRIIEAHPDWSNPRGKVEGDESCLYVGPTHGCLVAEILKEMFGVTNEQLKQFDERPTCPDAIVWRLGLPVTAAASSWLAAIQGAADGGSRWGDL